MELNKGNVKKIILILAFAIGFFCIITNFEIVTNILEGLIDLCFPLILGCSIAFIINVPMSWLERLIFSKVKNEKMKKLARPLSLVLTLALVVAIITGAILIIVPEIVDTIKNLVDQIPKSWDRFLDFINGTPLNDTFINKYEKEIEDVWNNVSDSVISLVKSGALGALNTGIGVVSGFVSGLTSFVIGLVFAIYILVQKEKLGNQITRLMKAVMPEKKVKKTLRILSLTYSTFVNFLTGQCLEACILGTMFVITMTILDIPYALLIGVLIAVTALIPIVGAFIGCIVGAFLIVIVSPIKALIFIIVFLVLQQIEGNLIYPHVVGNSVGLPSIWVLFAVTVGSKLMGILGMVIFIPIFSVLYALLREYVRTKEEAIAQKNIEIDIAEKVPKEENEEKITEK